jgi:hypothetical protein
MRLISGGLPRAPEGWGHPLLFALGGILLFDPRREHSSVPTASFDRRRAQGLSRLGRVFAATEGLALTAPSTAARSIGWGGALQSGGSNFRSRKALRQ